MKKIFLLFFGVLLFSACDVEDDGANSVQRLAEVVDTSLPESFEEGNVYQIEVTYLLPDACHSPLGLQAVRGALEGAARRDIYVAGVALGPAGDADCTRPDENLEKVSTFALRIDESQPYTFYLWKGLDANNESIYNKVVVPVMQLETSSASE